jgi:hypothetical protein
MEVCWNKDFKATDANASWAKVPTVLTLLHVVILYLFVNIYPVGMSIGNLLTKMQKGQIYHETTRSPSK